MLDPFFVVSVVDEPERGPGHGPANSSMNLPSGVQVVEEDEVIKFGFVAKLFGRTIRVKFALCTIRCPVLVSIETGVNDVQSEYSSHKTHSLKNAEKIELLNLNRIGILLIPDLIQTLRQLLVELFR